MPVPRVRLVVLNYNGGDLVERCVEHLENLDWPEDRLEIVVVDNASRDGSDEVLEQRPRVELIRSPKNTGFPANNLALRDLDGVDFAGLINNDAFADRDYLRPLVDALEAEPQLGAVCPRIVLAPRFLDLRLSSPVQRPPGDGRDLGVRISGVEVRGKDVWSSTLFAEGAFHPERGGPGEPEFRWCGGTALVRVPVTGTGGEVDGTPEGPGEPGVAALDGDVTVRVRLASDRTLTAALDGGGSEVSAEVTTEPRWVEVPLTGEPYDVINNVGSVLVDGGWGADRGFLEPDAGQYETAQDVFAWCGAGVLFRTDHLRDTGLFDERFFMYYEDTDMAWRGRARGWRYRYVPQARLRHVHAATSVEGSPMFRHYVERNRLLMLAKNAPRRWWLGATGRFLLSTASYARRDVLSPVLRARRPNLGLVRDRMRSFAAYLVRLPQMLRDRRRLRAGQVVHDEAIIGWAVRR